jgi:hypothetical protein
MKLLRRRFLHLAGVVVAVAVLAVTLSGHGARSQTARTIKIVVPFAVEPPSVCGNWGQRDLFVTGPGPDAGGSNQGKAGCVHRPENSGIDALPFVAWLAGPTAGGAVCAGAGVPAAVANITNRRKCHCILMLASHS